MKGKYKYILSFFLFSFFFFLLLLLLFLSRQYRIGKAKDKIYIPLMAIFFIALEMYFSFLHFRVLSGYFFSLLLFILGGVTCKGPSENLRARF